MSRNQVRAFEDFQSNTNKMVSDSGVQPVNMAFHHCHIYQDKYGLADT